MKILLIDADSIIPNIALMKLSSYYKELGHMVDFIKLKLSFYPSRKNNIQYIETINYDKAFCSVIFNNTFKYIEGNNITFGGSGFDLTNKLDFKVENHPLDYTLYPENNRSYGFITRGCIRNCYFCIVPKKEGFIRQVDTIENIKRHKEVIFLDNNILAFKDHNKIFQELIDKNIKHQWCQGLDIRLVNKDNIFYLKKLNHIEQLTFAFDDIKYMDILNEKIKLFKMSCDWNLRFYIYCSPRDSLDSLFKRIVWCRENKVLPYIMRDVSCYYSKYDHFYKDIAAWCNQPAHFKKKSFESFLYKRYTNQKRIESSLHTYNNIKENTTQKG